MKPDKINAEVIDFLRNETDSKGIAVLMQSGTDSAIRASCFNYINGAIHCLRCYLTEKLPEPTRQDVMGLMTYLANQLADSLCVKGA